MLVGEVAIGMLRQHRHRGSGGFCHDVVFAATFALAAAPKGLVEEPGTFARGVGGRLAGC